jgi:hypothetical protein
MVSVPPSPGRMPAMGIRTMENLLATIVSLLASPLSVRQVLTVNFRQPSHEFTFNVSIDLLF